MGVTVGFGARRSRSGSPLAGAVVLLLLLGACSPGQAAHRSDEPAASTPTRRDEAAVRRSVVAALRASEPGLAAVAERPDARFVPLDAPLFDRYGFYRVESLAPPHPVSFHVAVAHDGGDVVRLNAAPEGFAAVVSRDGVTVSRAADAVALVALWVETTRRTSRRYTLIDDPAALPLSPAPADAAEVAARQSKLDLARRSIAPPRAASAAGGAWAVTASLLDGQALQTLSAQVSKDGSLVVTTTPVVDDLPLTYVR